MSQYLDKDGASRIAENFLSKQAEQDVILANLQFDLKEAEHALVKTIQGPAPLNIRALTRPLDDYRISGNTVQDGTPAPDAPVDVIGCGEKTENLWNYTIVQGGWSATSGMIPFPYEPGSTNYPNRCRVPYMIPIPGNTMSCTCPSGIKINFVWIDANGVSMGGSGWQQSGSTVTAPENATTMTFILATVDESDCSPNDFQNIMLNTGSTAKPYEPYGYKLPITVNNTEHPIYLGNVQTTRRIRKLVLTGEENFGRQNVSSENPSFARFSKIFQFGSITSTIKNLYVSTHFHGLESFSTSGSTAENCFEMRFANGTTTMMIVTDAATTSASFNQWLATQYANGTPVTVWYVLATPTTGIVNEPLHKIRDYADTVSFAQAGIEISTTKGFNTITTDTTVLPSNIEVKGVISNA